MKTTISVILLAIFLSLLSCGFATDDISDKEYIEGPTKYKKLFVGPCSFMIKIETDIPYGWEHWKTNMHQFAVMSKNTVLERARYSTWDNLYTYVDCGFCTHGLVGVVNVMDSKDNLRPWGCGPERPPLDVLNVTSIYTSPKGSTSISDENNAQWEDDPLKVYERNFTPELMMDEKFCDGDPVLLDLDNACETLVDAGIMKRF